MSWRLDSPGARAEARRSSGRSAARRAIASAELASRTRTREHELDSLNAMNPALEIEQVAGYVFMCVWGVVALGLGSLFAFRPEIPADIYITWSAATRITHRVQQTFAPRPAILIFYRIGGAVFMLLGIVVPVLFFTGVISPSPR